MNSKIFLLLSFVLYASCGHKTGLRTPPDKVLPSIIGKYAPKSPVMPTSDEDKVENKK